MTPTLFESSLPTPQSYPRTLLTLTEPTAVKRLIWLYFWLLIFEGALRKWLLPGLSNPLLLIRDPVVVLIYILAGIAGVFPKNAFISAVLALGIISFFASEAAGTGNLLVSLFGLRTQFLHLPLIFVIAKVFTQKDVESMARWFLISCIPMCFLVMAQFKASPDAWLNNGAGGGQGSQLEGAFGRIRPPGTFSFTAGLVSYLSVASAFALHTIMHKGSKDAKLATGALPAIAIMVGISGSRTVLGAVTLILGAVGFICLRKPKFFGRGMKVVLMIGLAYFALASWSEFRDGVEVHQSRIEGGGGVKSGIFLRFFGELFPLAALMDAPFFGVGLGMGTNAASNFLYGQAGFSLGENDWERIIRESGPILGLSFIALRIAILVHLIRRAFESLDHDMPLPLLLFAAIAPEVLNGQLGVPMLLGWAVFGAGMCLASTNLTAVEGAVVPGELGEAVLLDQRSPRGRSVYAEQLHGEPEDPATARYGP